MNLDNLISMPYLDGSSGIESDPGGADVSRRPPPRQLQVPAVHQR